MIYVDESYLVGKMAGFPVEVLRAMCYEQYIQGNPFDPKVFQNHCSSNLQEGGFDWSETKQGSMYWDKVINQKQYKLIRQYYIDMYTHDMELSPNCNELWEVRERISDRWVKGGGYPMTFDFTQYDYRRTTINCHLAWLRTVLKDFKYALCAVSDSPIELKNVNQVNSAVGVNIELIERISGRHAYDIDGCSWQYATYIDTKTGDLLHE